MLVRIETKGIPSCDDFKTIRAATTTAITGSAMSSGPGGTRPPAQGANAASARTRPQNQPTRVRGLYREPLADPFGFSGIKGR